jgi:CrcB protein
MISNILFVGFGGALGAISRFGINEIMERHLINSSSYSVLLVNVIGCFLIGFIIGTSMPEKNTMYYFFTIGFLGSFTTMSALTYQTIMIANTNLIHAVSYIMFTVVMTIAATYIGTIIAK